MANSFFTTIKNEILNGNIDFANDDIRVMIVSTDTTVDTEEDTTFIDQFTTLDEFDGANYVRKTLANLVVTKDDANDRAEFSADNVVWSSLGSGTRSAAGLLIYKFVSDDTDSIPIMFIDDSAPFTPNGGDVTAQWPAEGIIQL